MPGSTNPPHPDRETRQQILDAAQQLFMERGYKAVSMKDIADLAHITSAGIYYYFPRGKEELLVEMLQAMITQWKVFIDQSTAQGGTLQAQLQRIALHFLNQPFDRLQLLLRDIHAQLPEVMDKGTLHRIMAELQQQISGLFQTASDTGEIRSDVPPSFLAELFGGMTGATVRYLFTAESGPHLSKEQAVATLVSTLLHGITPTK